MRAFVVDAFTDVAFRGNPAGVVFFDGVRGDAWMQSLAAELRHSETAFVTPRADGDHDLRWFTPAAEVDLCGHATLATAHALAADGTAGPYAFHTRSGVLRAEVSGGVVTLDFPAATLAPTDPAGAAAALGVAVLAAFVTSTDDLLCVLAGERDVAGLRPDIAAIAALGGRGVIATARADPGTGRDVVSRFFAPNVEVDEDPVTGSAHCALTPYWTGRLGRPALVADQLSPRGGRLHVELRDERVTLAGRAVTVLAGELLV